MTIKVTTDPVPEYWIVKVSNREHWSQDIQDKTKGIWAVFAFNRMEVTRICSPYENYYCIFLGHDYSPSDNISGPEADELSSNILVEYNNNEYYRVSHIESLLTDSDLARIVKLEDLEEDEEPFTVLREGWHTGSFMF